MPIFPQQGGSNNTWGTELRSFFSPFFDLVTGLFKTKVIPGSALEDLAVDTAQIKALAVTDAKINDVTWAKVNKTGSSIVDLTSKSHTVLTDVGTNTHAQIDTFVASKAQASGVASLDASSLVVQNPVNATVTPTASKIPIADGSGKLAAGWGGSASTLATLNGSGLVVQDPASKAQASGVASLNGSSLVVQKPADEASLNVNAAALTGITDDTTTNATMYPTWVTANTGNLPQKVSSTKLSFNPSTGVLTGIGQSLFARVTGSNATTTSLTLVDITGLTIPLIANAIYEFLAVMTCQSPDANGNRYGVQFSAAGGGVEGSILADTTGITVQLCERISTLNTMTTACVTAIAIEPVSLRGIVTTDVNPGDFKIQHAKVTSGTATVYVNSYLKVTRIA